MTRVVMNEELYKISVCEDIVSFDGTLTVEEMFDWLNYFDKKGFQFICTHPGDPIYMLKNPVKDEDDEDSDDEKSEIHLSEKRAKAIASNLNDCGKEELKQKIIELYSLVHFLMDCKNEEKIHGMAEAD